MTQRWVFSFLKYRCASLQQPRLCCCLPTNVLFLDPFYLCVTGNIFTTATTSLCSQQDTEVAEENPFFFSPRLLRQEPSPWSSTLAKLPALLLAG